MGVIPQSKSAEHIAANARLAGLAPDDTGLPEQAVALLDALHANRRFWWDPTTVR